MGLTRDLWLLSTVLLAVACATLGSPGDRLTALEAEAPSCADFPQLEARASAVLEALMQSSRDVLDASVRVSQARQACARNVMRSLLTLREQRGPEAAQQQLDAMAMALTAVGFASVTREAAADPNVGAMVALAAATAATSRTDKARTGTENGAIAGWQVAAPAGESPTAELDAVTAKAQVKHCAALGPDAQLTCLAEVSMHVLGRHEREALTEAARGAARRKIEALRLVPAAQRGAALLKLLVRLDALSVDEPSVQAELEVARAAAWPAIMAARSAGRIEEAAAWARPFRVLPSSSAEVGALQDRAASRQLQLANEAGGRVWAAALHRKLAARFGAPEASWPESPGQWDLSRFECGHSPGALPPAAGLSLRLVATCKKTKRASDSVAQADPAMKTFENERSLEWEDIEGTLFVTCASKVLSFRVMSRDLALEGAAEQSALGVQLQKLISRATPECRAARAALVERDCASIETANRFDTEDHFTEHALALQQWPLCFTRWLDERIGLAPPPPFVLSDSKAPLQPQ